MAAFRVETACLFVLFIPNICVYVFLHVCVCLVFNIVTCYLPLKVSQRVTSALRTSRLCVNV